MYAIHCGKMITAEGRIEENKTVIVDEGKIVGIEDGKKIPSSAELIDAAGLWVSPGLIEAHCHAAAYLDDLNEMSAPIVPDTRALDAINPFNKDIPIIRKAGFTTLCVLPGSANLIGGSGAVIKLKEAKTAEEMAAYGKEPFKMALGENPSRIYGLKGQMPMTRMGNAALLRRTFVKAQNYLRAKEEGSLKEIDPQMEAIVPVLKREKRVRIHSHDARDLVTAVRIAREFNLDFTLEHVTQGEKISDWLGENQILCTVGPALLQPIKHELEKSILPTLPGQLEKAGVEFALLSDETFAVMYLPMYVGHCIPYGLSWEAGIRAITINAAKILEIDDRVGSIEVGKDADLAFFNGDPLSNTTRCVGTMIDGQLTERNF